MAKIIKLTPKKKPKPEGSRMLTTKEQWALRADLKKKAAWLKKQTWD